MTDTDFCIMCGKSIGMWDKTCKHCGTNQFGENNEFYPSEKSVKETEKLIQGTVKNGLFEKILGSKQKQPMFTEEQRFLMGIHPNDETYRKTMELDILSKNYK